MTFGERLKYIMELRHKKSIDVSSGTGLSQPLISNYLNDKHLPKYEHTSLLADYLDVNVNYLLGLSNQLDRNAGNLEKVLGSSIRIPIYAPISCGSGSYEDDEVIDFIAIPEDKIIAGRKYFGQYALGNSMINVGIDDGDLLVFEATSTIENGQVGAFCIDSEHAVCKKFMNRNGVIYLVSANEDYLPIEIDVTNNHFVVVGVLRFILKDVK